MATPLKEIIEDIEDLLEEGGWSLHAGATEQNRYSITDYRTGRARVVSKGHSIRGVRLRVDFMLEEK